MRAIVHLVGLAVAECRGRVGGIAEGTIEDRGILGGIGQYLGLVSKASLAESLFDGFNLTIHHGRRRHEVGTCLGMLIGHFGQQRQCCVVVYIVMVQ